MSHLLYLQCASHNPPIDSDELYHNLGGLNMIFDALKKKTELQEAVKIYENLFHELPYIEGDVDMRCARFFYFHPECELKVIDEYGKYYTDEREAKPNE